MIAAMRLAVWCEFLPYAEVIPLLGDLAARGVGLNLAVQSDRRDDPDLLPLLAGARARGIDVRPWILLDRSAGYWPNAWNAPEVAEAAIRLASAAASRGVRLDWLVFDMEPPPELAASVAERLDCGDFLGAWRALRAGAPPHGEPQATYRELLRELRERGVRSQLVTLPLALDGPRAGRLLAALGIDYLDLDWDEIAVMAYRPEFCRILGPLGPDLVRRYGAAALARFGQRASVAIGEVGTPGFPAPVPGYTDPADLQGDLAACREAGLSSVSIFSLDGLLEQGGLARWLDAPPEASPPREFKAALARLAAGAIGHFLPYKPGR